MSYKHIEEEWKVRLEDLPLSQKQKRELLQAIKKPISECQAMEVSELYTYFVKSLPQGQDIYTLAGLLVKCVRVEVEEKEDSMRKLMETDDEGEEEDDELEEPEQPTAKKSRSELYPSVSKSSITDKAKHPLSNKWLTLPLFGHWFAIELYNIYLLAEEELRTSENDTIVLSNSCSLQRSLLNSISSKLATACKLPSTNDNIQGRGLMASAAVRNCEIAWTAMCAAHLQSLFSNLSLGVFMHQVPTNKKTNTPETVDWYFATCDQHGQPLTPVGLGDGKLHDLALAIRTSVYHSQNCIVIRHEINDWPIMLAFPATPDQACLHLHIPVDNAMWQVHVINHLPLWDKGLLCTLYYGLHRLTNYPVVTDYPITTNTPKNVPLMPLKDTTKYPDKVCVFQEENKVVKYYDSSLNLVSKHNVEIIKACSNLPDVGLQCVTTDRRIQCLEYTYIKGDHKPINSHQFVGVLKTLSKMHQREFVHSDVRLANIVFTEESSFLIDFDLTDKVGTRYPAGYSKLDERHKNAISLAMREKIHDRHAVWYLLKRCVGVDIKELTDPSIELSDIIDANF